MLKTFRLRPVKIVIKKFTVPFGFLNPPPLGFTVCFSCAPRGCFQQCLSILLTYKQELRFQHFLFLSFKQLLKNINKKRSAASIVYIPGVIDNLSYPFQHHPPIFLTIAVAIAS